MSYAQTVQESTQNASAKDAHQLLSPIISSELKTVKINKISCPITIGGSSIDGKGLHLKHAPTIVIDPKSSKKFLWKKKFERISASDLPKFKLIRPNKFDLNELVHSCTRYNLDEFLSILMFAQENKNDDHYLWKKLQEKGDYLVAFSKGDFIYKAYIGKVQELHVIIHDMSYMHYLSSFDYILSGPNSAICIQKSVEKQKQGIEKLEDFVKRITNEFKGFLFGFSLN